MRLIRKVILLILFCIIGYYLLTEMNLISNQPIDKINHLLNEKKLTLNTKENQDLKQPSSLLEEDLVQLVGKSSSELVKALGEPKRKDLSAYGYTWWIYTDKKNEYIQFGINNNKIETIFVTGNDFSIESIQTGQSYDSVNEQFEFENLVKYTSGLSSYEFNLTTDEILQRPLAKITDNLFIQFYFDTFTQKLSSIRILTADTLLNHLPYALEYRGSLPSETPISDDEWLEIERGMEQQIFDITNVIRNRFEKSALAWEETVHEVAFMHSKDMSDNDYFSHEGLNGTGLKDRLALQDISYQAAGENIAAQYSDAPAAMEGWLNSEGHRDALLEERYTHLGVGVYRLYFTQNFIDK